MTDVKDYEVTAFKDSENKTFCFNCVQKNIMQNGILSDHGELTDIYKKTITPDPVYCELDGCGNGCPTTLEVTENENDEDK